MGAATRVDAPVERTWLYLDEPRVPAPLQVTALTRATVASGGASFTRPFAANTAAPGISSEVGGEIGLFPRVSLAASGVLGESSTGAGAVGALAGMRVSVLPTSWMDTHAVVSGGYLRELGGASGAWARVSVSQDFGRLRIASTVHGERVFARGRDDVDMMLMAGANVRVADTLRLGAEYVAQDIEAAIDPEEAEGGMRHFIGPTTSLALVNERLTIGAGPAFGISPNAPRVLGRAAVSWSF